MNDRRFQSPTGAASANNVPLSFCRPVTAGPSGLHIPHQIPGFHGTLGEPVEVDRPTVSEVEYQNLVSG